MSTKTIVITAGIHGDEPESLSLAQQVRALLEQKGLCGRDYRVLFHGMLNPSGFAAGTRKNADGIDLNREWDAERGNAKSAACVRAWADIIAHEGEGDDLLVVDCHSIEGTAGVFYAGPLGKEVAENRFRLVARTDEWRIEGTLLHACESRGIRALVVETAKGDSCTSLAVAVHQALWSWAGFGPTK